MDNTDDKKERILNAAVKVVNKVGFHRATMDAIAKEASLSKGGLFYYFKSKNLVFLGILDRTFERILKDAYAVYEELPDRPGRMLKAYVISWIKYQQPEWWVQIMGLLEDDELRERLILHRLRHYELVLDGRIPELVAQKVLLICAGLWTTPLLARAEPEALLAFFEVMKGEMLTIIDEAADRI